MSTAATPIPPNGPAPVIPATTAPLPPPSSGPPPPPAVIGIPDNDNDRWRNFREWLDDDWRYIVAWKTWAFWDGECWTLDSSQKEALAILKKASEWADHQVELANILPPGPQQLAALSAAKRCSSYDHMKSMIALLRTATSCMPTDFDADPYLLGVQNGVVNLRTGEHRAAEKEDMLLKRCQIDFKAGVGCPMWEAFLEDVQPDADIRDFLQRAIGYACTGMTTEQVLFFLFGLGQNGKSTFIETIEHILGDYVWRSSADLFLETRADDNKMNMLASLPEKRFVVGAEMPQDGRLAENRIKDLTGGDMIVARKLFCEAFNYRPTHKLFFYGNHRPTIRGTDTGIWRRLLLIPFSIEVPEAKRDRGIVERLRSESQGILNWMLEGCLLWQAEGLNPPESVRAAVAEYRDEEDLINQFVEQFCELGDGLSVDRRKLSYAFECWMKEAGYKFTLSPRAVGDRVSRLPGVRPGKKSGNARFWSGIALRDAKAFVGGPK